MTEHPTQRPTIVVGYVPSELGRAALRAAIGEARLVQGGLHVVNSSRADAYVDRHLADPAGLAELEALLAEADVPHEVVQHVGEGEPADQIVEAARRTDARLIVLGLRHRTQVGKLLLGSTAQRVLMDAPCAVLAVKG
jgi:nucleotide-binding universal stress UspA family protein